MARIVMAVTGALAVVVLPPTVTAEPLATWSYSAQVSPADPPTGGSPGSGLLSLTGFDADGRDGNPSGDPPGSFLFGVAGYDLGGRSGIDALHQVRPASESGFAGQATVVISTASVRETAGLGVLPRDFRYLFEVTDAASEESQR